jgi:DNA polymerase family A/3'-5' exonuclease
MGWTSAVKKSATTSAEPIPKIKPKFDLRAAVSSIGGVAASGVALHKVDFSKLVVLDMETFYSSDYTLRKLSTSEYVRDERFYAQMVGIKVGNKAIKVVPHAKIQATLDAIDWSTHSLLCHHTQFDGFILSHHYGIKPRFLYCTLSMARGLHSNDIGAGLDEVAQYYGVGNKLEGALESMKGIRELPPAIYKKGAAYCAEDVRLTLEIFKMMLAQFPAREIEQINLTCRLFTDPVLKVDIPLVEKELVREIAYKEQLLLSSLGTDKQIEKMLKNPAPAKEELKKLKEKGILEPTPRDILLTRAKMAISKDKVFAQMLTDLGVEPPMKISPAYFKHRDPEKKYAYAFAKTDLAFTSLQEHPSQKIRDLVEVRLSVKSTTNETRAGRFLTAGANGWCLPVYLRFYGAHTGRWSGGNKMNMQNLKREDPDDPENTGILRKSILAPKGHQVVVVDSGQIEARVNAWLAGQTDLLEAFRKADAGLDRDAYCKFADKIYGRTITKKDKLERFVGKIAVLGLGYQMGANKFQNTLALGTMGPPVFFEEALCKQIVNTYRRENYKIKQFWDFCTDTILPQMARGIEGSYKCLRWEKDKIWLPNGMALKYPNLRCERNDESGWDEWTYERKGERAKIYGGLLTENIVQALARIIVGEQMLNIDNMGHRVVTTTHDEVVCIAKNARAKKCFADMTKCMRTPPAWCADIPLNCEGGHAINYSK